MELTAEQKRRIHDLTLRSISLWGVESQFGQLVEECGEAIVAVQHLSRSRVDRRALVEKLVGIEMMIENMKVLMDDPAMWHELREEQLVKWESHIVKAEERICYSGNQKA